MQLLYLDPQWIEQDPEGVREETGDLGGLMDTMRDQGLLQPLGVIARGREHYRVVYGGRRLAAALQLGLDRVPCIVLDADDPDLLLRQLLENVQRRDLNDLEKAHAFRRLRQQLIERAGPDGNGEIDERLAQAVGLAPRTVRRYLGLLDLPPEVQQLLRDEELTVTQAQHLRRLGDPRAQVEIARHAADEGLSAAQISKLATYLTANPNLTLGTALEALEQGQELRTEATAPPVESPRRAPPPKVIEADDDSDLWNDEPTPAEDAFAFGEAGQPDSRNKARVFRIKSLDQMVDETERLARAYHEGDLKKWVKNDEGAAFKVRLLQKQLRALAHALEAIASEQGWSL